MVQLHPETSTVPLLLLLLLPPSTNAFIIIPRSNIISLNHNTRQTHFGPCYAAGNSGKGFAKSNNPRQNKPFIDQSYGTAARPPAVAKDIIDVEGAMSSFFSTNTEWIPLFRSLTSTGIMTDTPYPEVLFHLSSVETPPLGSPVEYGVATPWKQFEATPKNKKELDVIAAFLDAAQKSLIDIPVDESVEEDASDVHFIEEGRRLLAINRFHVLSGETTGRSPLAWRDELFAVCWSEMAELRRVDEVNSGSLIIVPDYNLNELTRFTEMNIHAPLDWLGLAGSGQEEIFEVASLQRGELAALRILHRLGEVPDVGPEGVVE